jgi:hypothetical protein
MGKPSKATRKFAKKHLKGEIQKRKGFKNFKKNQARRQNVGDEGAPRLLGRCRDWQMDW